MEHGGLLATMETGNISTYDEVHMTLVMTLLLRCGYILVHIGCIPTTNVNNIYTGHLFNMGATTLIYALCGSSLTLGNDWHGLLGVNWIKKSNYTDMVNVWSYFIHSTSIIQLVTAGRIHMLGDLIATVAYAGIIYPLVVHGAWTPQGWMRQGGIVSNVCYDDMGGGSVIHLFAGAYAFSAMMVFGGRIININRLDHSSLAINAQATTTLGYLLIISCTSGLMLLSPYIAPGKIADTQINIIIALATGLTIATLFYFPMKNTSYWTIIWILQGGMASLIVLAPGIGIYNPVISFFYALIGVLSYLLFSVIIRTSGLEDYSNIISIHLIQGIIGPYLISFHNDNNVPNNFQVSNKLLWQGICSGMIFFFGGLTSMTVHLFLFSVRILRNKDEQDIFRETGNLQSGCCPSVKRTLDASSGDLIRPGYHTFMKFRTKPNSTEQEKQTPIVAQNSGDTYTYEPTEI